MIAGLALFTIIVIQSTNSMIDVDTPQSKHHTIRLHDRANLTLVMSDEYRASGRSFGPGEDPIFEATNQPGQTTSKELQYYNSSTEFVTTKDGYLIITTKRKEAMISSFDYQTYSMLSQAIKILMYTLTIRHKMHLIHILYTLRRLTIILQH